MTPDAASRFGAKLAAGVVLLSLFVYTLAAFTLYATWHEYEMRVESSTQNLARVIESSVTGVIDKADVALRSVVDEAERQLAAGEIDAAALNSTIARQTARVPELDGIRLANAAGEILYGTGVDPAAPVNVTDREYFQWARDNPAADTYVSKPYVGRIAQQWVFALARRIEHPDGRFAGVAVGVFPIQYFTDFFSAIDVGQDGAVVLRYDDMAVVARYPEVEGSIGQTQVSPELTAMLAAGKPAATYAATAVVDNIRRIYSYQKVPDLPFYVFVGQSLGVMVENWRNEALVMLVVLLIFTLVTFAGSRQLVRSWQQQKQAELDLRLANQVLEERVEERTRALRVSNEQLQVELAERRQVETAEREQRALAEALRDTASALARTLDLNRIWAEILSNVRRVVPLNAANIALLDEDHRLHYESFMGYEAHPIVQEELDSVFVALDQLPIFRRVYETGEPLVIPDTRADPDWISLPGSSWICSFAVMPIRINGRVVGFLNLDGATPGLYTPEHLERLRAFADQAAVAIENARLYTEAQQEIAERKRAEAALLQAKETAEAANRAKSVFLANMSHELRTPLNAILGFSELMTRDPKLSPAQAENLAIINRSGEHLLGLINDVLDLAKIEAGRTALQEHAFDLHRLLDDLGDLFQLRAAAKGLVLHVTRAADVPQFVDADEGKLRQVLINLLGNAVKFTSAGSVDLFVAPVASQSTAAICRLRCVVQDTGPGIPPKELATIFEPFVQGASGHTAPEGTGLGLPISRRFARLMGGDLNAFSTGIPGEGSRFEVVLPLRLAAITDVAPAQSTRAQHAIGLEPGQPVYRLLVVEDHAASRQLLVELLLQLGFAVRTAANGLEALQVWAEWQPHLIWMDMRMPVMDGHEATRQIKRTPQGQQTVIVALSASVLAEQRTAMLAEGCDDIVHKPYRESEIVDCLVRWLGVRMVYGAEPSSQPTWTPAAPSTFDLADLPAEWCAQAQQAATAADAARLRELAAALADVQPALANALHRWVEDYDYTAVLALVRGRESAQTTDLRHAAAEQAV